jgi:hypothetical protein
MFEDLDKTIIMNEPTALYFLVLIGRMDLLRTVLFFLCKRLFFSQDRVNTVVIKLPPTPPQRYPNPGLIQGLMDLDMRKKMPFNMHFFYVYRKPLPSMISWLKMTNEFNIDALALASKIPGLGKLYLNWLDTGAVLKILQGMIPKLKSLTSEKWQEKYSWLEEDDFTKCDLNFVRVINGRPAVTGEFHDQADNLRYEHLSQM